MTRTPADTPEEPVTIELISDLVCPWCYIGKRQLDDAIERWRDAHPDAPAPRVSWHPFQLNPTMPAEGIARSEYLQAKFGDPEGGPGYARVRSAAAGAGLTFHPERIDRQPNTLRAHALIRSAEGEVQHRLAARLFDDYFVRGRDIGDPDTLREAARSVGMSEAGADAALSDESLAATEAVDAALREAGIAGVPFFVVGRGRKLSISGAQGTDRLLRALEAVCDA